MVELGFKHWQFDSRIDEASCEKQLSNCWVRGHRSQVRWLVLVIPAPWEAEAGRSLEARSL